MCRCYDLDRYIQVNGKLLGVSPLTVAAMKSLLQAFEPRAYYASIFLGKFKQDCTCWQGRSKFISVI
jgi:hypothetical protein